jgi:hypothetical protein
MKRIVVIAIGTLALFAVGLMYTVWRASQESVTRTPGPLETGRAQLQAQLQQAEKSEGAAERQNWNSPGQLRALVQGHELRIEKLKSNKEAAEILAYDRDSIVRLQKRIAEIAQEEAAKAQAAQEAAKRAAEEQQQQ